MTMRPRSLFEKIWNNHTVAADLNGADLLYIDLHLLHEVTSPQAFDGLRQHGRPVRRPDLTVAVEDHNVPTDDAAPDAVGRAQLEALRANCAAHGIELYALGHERQGI